LFGDPEPRVTKALFVTVDFHGRMLHKVFEEDEPLCMETDQVFSEIHDF